MWPLIVKELRKRAGISQETELSFIMNQLVQLSNPLTENQNVSETNLKKELLFYHQSYYTIRR